MEVEPEEILAINVARVEFETAGTVEYPFIWLEHFKCS